MMPDMRVHPSPHGDFVLPFDLPKAGVRGRLVRLDSASGRALSAHALPEEAARVTGEVVALGAILGSALKLDGRLTVQTKGDGPLDLVTADYFGTEADKVRGVRGFARLDGERFAAHAPARFVDRARFEFAEPSRAAGVHRHAEFFAQLAGERDQRVFAGFAFASGLDEDARAAFAHEQDAALRVGDDGGDGADEGVVHGVRSLFL